MLEQQRRLACNNRWRNFPSLVLCLTLLLVAAAAQQQQAQPSTLSSASSLLIRNMDDPNNNNNNDRATTTTTAAASSVPGRWRQLFSHGHFWKTLGKNKKKEPETTTTTTTTTTQSPTSETTAESTATNPFDDYDYDYSDLTLDLDEGSTVGNTGVPPVVKEVENEQETKDAKPSQTTTTGNNPHNENVGADASAARKWNEMVLTGIRNDFARPTVHARNLFHTSAAMYDAWTAFDHTGVSQSYLLGKKVPVKEGNDKEFECSYSATESGFNMMQGEQAHAMREEAISFAVYRIIKHRFKTSARYGWIDLLADRLLEKLGYDRKQTSTDYIAHGASGLGNYIAECYINYGMKDGANEANGYDITYYKSVNPTIEPELPGNPNIIDMDHWQAINLSQAIDQAGNVVADVPKFVGPEWGNVMPFSLTENERTVFQRDGNNWTTYFEAPAPPSYKGDTAEYFKWGFQLVTMWGSHLDPADGVMVDISPATLGNVSDYPDGWENFHKFYNAWDGTDTSRGYKVNPKTGQPYEPQMVPRADYSRVLAEFWADGPDSETPPGHWFVILNTVNDHPQLQRKFQGQGPELSKLEWDVKTYFTLGGAMHDSAITAWGYKGYYDYVRPISAIRGMAERGQSTSPDLPNYHPEGIPLEEGYVELVKEGDPLDWDGENRNKIKLYTWRGPDYIDQSEGIVAGVGWILADNWWPYQRPTFVQPPFAAYVSGHSTFSRAGAEVLTLLTGDNYFPGGMSDFFCQKHEFLVFETGPSVNLTLQWATYQDASDQCSLSRIFGGIHPPQDDLPGRKLGMKIGPMAFEKAAQYFDHCHSVNQPGKIRKRQHFDPCLKL